MINPSWAEVDEDGDCLVFESKADGVLVLAYENGCVDIAGSGCDDSIHACDLDVLVSSLGNLKAAIQTAFLRRGKLWPK